jgi:CDP-glycerol glycerophosphotransferase (TagB/SpsB family)
LESTSAIYPRIVIDENIVQMHSVEGAKVKLAGERLIVQQNGVYFIHILDDANWAAVYEAAKRAYTRDKEAMLLSEAALSKHAWFERYLSTFLPSGEVFSPYIELAQLY